MEGKIATLLDSQNEDNSFQVMLVLN